MQVADIHRVVKILKDLLLKGSAEEIDRYMRRLGDGIVLYAGEVSGFREALFGLLENVAEPDLVDQYRQTPIRIFINSESGTGDDVGSFNNIIGYDMDRKVPVPSRIDFEGMCDDYMASYFHKALDKGLSPGAAWVDAREKHAAREKLAGGVYKPLGGIISLNLSHEIGHFLELMRQGSRHFPKYGLQSDMNARFNNATSQLVDMVAGRSRDEVRQMLGGDQMEFLRRINRWSGWGGDRPPEWTRGDPAAQRDYSREIGRLTGIYDAALAGKYASLPVDPDYSVERVRGPQFRFHV